MATSQGGSATGRSEPAVRRAGHPSGLHAAPQQPRRARDRLSERNHREDTGVPFAALVVEWNTGRTISAGVNLVLSSSAHAVSARGGSPTG
jgi:hypothetical protein